jgi:hypothetical protein
LNNKNLKAIVEALQRGGIEYVNSSITGNNVYLYDVEVKEPEPVPVQAKTHIALTEHDVTKYVLEQKLEMYKAFNQELMQLIEEIFEVDNLDD